MNDLQMRYYQLESTRRQFNTCEIKQKIKNIFRKLLENNNNVYRNAKIQKNAIKRGDAQSVYLLPVPCDGGTNTVCIALCLHGLPSWLQRLATGRSSATGASPRLWASSSPPEGAVASGLLVKIVARMSSEIRSFCFENNTEILIH